MGLFFFIGIAVGVFITLGISRIKLKEFTGMAFCIIMSLFLTIIAFLGYFTSRSTPEKLQEEIKEYNDLKLKVEYVKEIKDPGLRGIFDSELNEKVSKMNRKIRSNRTKYNSWFDGYKYSKEFGNLEELVYE